MTKKNQIRYWLPLGVYCLLILFQSSRPVPFPALRHADKLVHFSAYAVLGILIFRAIRSLPKKTGIVFDIVMAVFLSAVIGCSDEIIQIFVPSRSIDRVDFYYDVIGSFSGILLYIIATMIRKRLSQRTGKPPEHG